MSKSLFETDKDHCFICGATVLNGGTHKHHLFPGKNRQISEEDGMWVYLCPWHHILGNHSVHNDPGVMQKLQRMGQAKYEETHTREEFIKRYGKSYIDAFDIDFNPEIPWE